MRVLHLESTKISEKYLYWHLPACFSSANQRWIYSIWHLEGVKLSQALENLQFAI